ncbi:hypothetical protein [Halomonas sp. N3-2A]|uniref:hypothetical protein n=1 Tax=Halomonas sp. N3-2A TaxID=2014541 RepID=UPI000B5B3110|nr:hypothetical protein [Halomonas sp. N3-2A]ASK18858.1 hypothetical protein CEK60_05870 [Halomonas sp. N3-2A]
MSFEQAVVQLEQTNSKLQEEVVRFRDAAMGLNAIYSTITEGRQNTADGKYFSVPGNGAYMRLYRRQGSSAELIAEFPDRNELNSVIDQLGPLLGRGVVGGGTDDLMAVGAFGLGSTDRNSAVVTDGNASLPSGFFGGTGSQGINFPAGAQYRPLINVNRRSGPGVYNTLRLFSTSSELVVRTGTITDGEAIWDSDSRIYTDKNVLGPVSHLAGVPTGAIIETGNTPDGRYRKFADGSMECGKTFEVTDIGEFGSGTFTDPYRTNIWNWDFPKLFISAPQVASFCTCSTTIASERINSVVANSLSNSRASGVQVYRGSNALGTQAPVIVTLTASGRWRE